MAVTIEPHELEPFRAVMRDLQTGAAWYYAQTASGGELGSTVRSFMANCQVLNDWFVNAIDDAASYKALFDQPRRTGADVIDAMKYVRNVSQHVLHVVKPSDTAVLVGGQFGLRGYFQWEAIPEEVHAKLRKGTQALRPTYEANLSGKELLGTMMEVLRFYADVAPSLVHRDEHGEWTGFPLMSQPGILDPIHPEEPRWDIAQARVWMDIRGPGGDARVICGQVTIDEVPYFFGYTFVGRLSFAPFVETAMQINKDIAIGFPYLEGNLAANVFDVSGEHVDARQGRVYRSSEDLATWTTRSAQVEAREDWCSPGFDLDSWRIPCALEGGGLTPDYVAHGVRRARRLNALVPPRHL
ncbi:hypothetical protein ACIOTN_13880 [Glutamicibacter sp. NPDC087661]|uniref:hypothetical protein n=1 Tax=Glutamicibacter sp. NPDC087661 TaxID=3363996 RepID=UPI00381E2F9B